MDSSGCGWGNQYQATPLINDVLKAVNGEYQAIETYTRLADLAPTREERDRLLEIRQDEIRHYDSFLNIYRQITGTQPKLTGAEECPRNYRKGLLASFKDEQETTDFYRMVVTKTEANYVKDVFFQAALDEQNHAVWFSFYYFFRKGHK